MRKLQEVEHGRRRDSARNSRGRLAGILQLWLSLEELKDANERALNPLPLAPRAAGMRHSVRNWKSWDAQIAADADAGKLASYLIRTYRVTYRLRRSRPQPSTRQHKDEHCKTRGRENYSRNREPHHAKDDNAKGFYEHFDFEPSSTILITCCSS